MKRNVFLRLGVLLVTCLLMPTTVFALGDAERVFYSYDASDGLADNSAQSILCTRTGRMLISTIGHINFYDGDTFVHIDPEEENIFPLPKYRGHYHLYFDKHHHLWVKDQRQVTCVDLTMERFVTNVGDILKELGMKERYSQAIYSTDWTIRRKSVSATTLNCTMSIYTTTACYWNFSPMARCPPWM